MDAAKILLVDDHALFRHGVRAIIERERDLEVVGEAPSCQEALLLAQKLHPDLIVIDVCLSDSGGLETISTLKRELPAAKIVVLTVHDEDESRRKAIRDGAEGFLSKGVRARVLLESLRSIMWGPYVMGKRYMEHRVEAVGEIRSVPGVGRARSRSDRRRPSIAGRIAKRAFDILVSLAALVLLSPLFGVVALLIKLDSRGPVFYGGKRIGKEGRPFCMFKFRTMQDVPVDTGPRVTACDDPRITRLGHILRDTKLNEFPQFLNVLKGEMSLVGPRPEDPKYVALYTPEQRRVLSVTPGITSVASILYRNEEEMMCQDTLEETYVNVIMPHKLGLDLEYVDHRSFLVDLDILLRTVLALPPLFARAAPDVEELLFGPVQSFVRRSLSWFSLDFMLGLLGISMASFVWRHAGTPVNAGRPWPYRMALTAGIALTFTLVNQAYGLHHSLWSYASGQEVVDILVATALSTVLSLIAGGIGFHLPPEWILLTGFFSFALFTAARYRTRLIRGARWRWRDLRQKPLDEARTRLLIVGTGGAGRLLAWWIQSQHYGRRYQIVGFVDGDLTRRGLRIRGLEILGGCRAIPALVARYKIDIIVVTVPDADTLDQQIILDICHSTPAQVEIIPDILKFIREPGQASPGRD